MPDETAKAEERARAIDVIAYIHRMPYADGLEMVTNYFLIARAEGFKDGVEAARQSVNRVIEEHMRNLHARSDAAVLKLNRD